MRVRKKTGTYTPKEENVKKLKLFLKKLENGGLQNK
jgi:hypothetical protein